MGAEDGDGLRGVGTAYTEVLTIWLPFKTYMYW